MHRTYNSGSLPPCYLSLVFLVVCCGILTSAASAVKVGINVTTPAECVRKTRSGDKIEVHYKGSLQDGTIFDSSYKRKEPFAFTLGIHEVIQGWDDGLLGMCIGEGRRLIIPPELGYGSVEAGSIPPDSTLYFETELLGIDGVEPEPTPSISGTDDLPEGDRIHLGQETKVPEVAESDPSLPEGPDSPGASGPGADPDGECRLLGPFALLVQGGLGLLAILSLVWKRWRERPRRPMKIWFFDVSKQVFGSFLLHGANLLMSMLSSGGLEFESKASKVSQLPDSNGRAPNPCSFYLINIAVDTTIGIPILVVLLRLLHYGFSITPLARPKESIKSGHYGQPPRATWWLKQSIIYFIGLLLMKLCVFFIFQLLPWIAWIGDWALRWTEGSEALQIAFVMFVFPLIMNALQYYIIDSFIKEPQGKEGEHGNVREDDLDDESREPLRDSDNFDADYDSSHDAEEPKTPKSMTAEVEPVRQRLSQAPSPANVEDSSLESDSSSSSRSDDRSRKK
ncbi:MAG: hypothetical protein M1828_003057 [Chrysothrix sp. TS-e1954]|nr:MAG: hypothetical protein M1828_003057 [Chrysothrix sp. TS-e1954]